MKILTPIQRKQEFSTPKIKSQTRFVKVDDLYANYPAKLPDYPVKQQNYHYASTDKIPNRENMSYNYNMKPLEKSYSSPKYLYKYNPENNSNISANDDNKQFSNGSNSAYKKNITNDYYKGQSRDNLLNEGEKPYFTDRKTVNSLLDSDSYYLAQKQRKLFEETKKMVNPYSDKQINLGTSNIKDNPLVFNEMPNKRILIILFLQNQALRM